MAMETDRERLAQVEVRVEEQGGRLIDLSQQIRDLDRKVDAKFDALDARILGRFDTLQSEMIKQFRWTIGIMLTLAGLLHFAR
jgi:uncharacterized coiled-coil protein SlyX